MNKEVNGVASEYEMPMIYENKTTTNKLKNEQIFTVWQDPIIEKLQQENQQLKEKVNKFNIAKLEQENKSLKGSCRVLGEKDNNQRKELKRLNDKLYKLEEIINKAIGHINACGCELSKDETRYLLEILKGEN